MIIYVCIYIYIHQSHSLVLANAGSLFQQMNMCNSRLYIYIYIQYIYIYVRVDVYNYTRCFDGHTHMYTLTTHLQRELPMKTMKIAIYQ